jgi:hypothetical protein
MLPSGGNYINSIWYGFQSVCISSVYRKFDEPQAVKTVGLKLKISEPTSSSVLCGHVTNRTVSYDLAPLMPEMWATPLKGGECPHAQIRPDRRR